MYYNRLRLSFVSFGLACAGIALSLTSRPAHAQLPALRLIAATGQTFDGKTLTSVDNAALNNNTLVFSGGYSGGRGVFTQNGASNSGTLITTGQQIGTTTISSIGTKVDINNNNTIAFIGNAGVFTQSGRVNLFAPTQFGKSYGAVTNFSLNDNGDVAALRDYTLMSGTGHGIYTQTTRVSESVPLPGGPYGSTEIFDLSAPSISNGGDVAHQRFYQGPTNAFYVNNTLIAKLGANTYPGFESYSFTSISSNTISGNGVFAFGGGFSTSSSSIHNGIFTSSGVLVEDGQTIGGKTITSLTPNGGIAINDGGTVAFLGSFSGGSGIFTQNGLIAETGQIVGGKTISSFVFDSVALNNFGDISFKANFSDGSNGIVLANITGSSFATPEPGTLTLLALPIIPAALYLRRRNRKKQSHG